MILCAGNMMAVTKESNILNAGIKYRVVDALSIVKTIVM